MNKRKLHIGTNFGHSSATCLIGEDGIIQLAVEEDRLINEKHTSKFPLQGIKLALEPNLINEKIYWNEGWHNYKRLFYKGIMHSLRYIADTNYIKERLIKEVKRFAKGINQYNSYGPFNFVGHHLAHAYSLLPFGLPLNSLVFISDTMGENESISIFYWDGNFRLIKKIGYPHSPGSVFHQMAIFLGFKGRTAPGKLMALAGHGSPKWVEQFLQIGRPMKGDFRINQMAYPSYRIKNAPERFIQKLSNIHFKQELVGCRGNYEQGTDIAASVQEWFTLCTWNLIQQSLSIARDKMRLKIDHLAMAGGSALNCQANGFIKTQLDASHIGDLVISPWPEDSGTAIGAASASYCQIQKKYSMPLASPFLGPSAFSTNRERNVLPCHINMAVEAILAGYFVALVSGKLEFGPRALGGRCILGSPFQATARKEMNKVKGRPEFMPFAPAVLKEDFDKFFYGQGSTIMAWTVKVKKSAFELLPSAIHVNGHARAQVVNEDISLLFQILQEVKFRTGSGILLLTSLNGDGETVPVTYQKAKETAKNLHLYGMISDVGWELL